MSALCMVVVAARSASLRAARAMLPEPHGEQMESGNCFLHFNLAVEILGKGDGGKERCLWNQPLVEYEIFWFWIPGKTWHWRPNDWAII